MNIDLDKVPVTITESLTMFMEALTDEEKKTIKDVDEDQIALFHHSFGQDIRNNWSTWEENTPLVNNFKELGITHPDDMSGIILKSTWRVLNKKAIKLQEQIKLYQEYWNKEIGKPMP